MNTNRSRRNFIKALGIASTSTVLGYTIPKPLLASLAPPYLTETRILMGTFVTIAAVHPSTNLLEEAINKSFETIVQKEAIFSHYAVNTPMYILNTQGKLDNAPRELIHVIQKSLSIEQETSGAFDITVKPIINFLQTQKNPTQSLSIDPNILLELVELTGSSHIHLTDKSISFSKKGMELTLDGIAKGYICDCASKVLTDYGVHNHLINAGGDIMARGYKSIGQPWNVAIENPKKRGTYLEVLSLTDKAIATSGSYEHYFDAEQKYHHLIDPSSGKSPWKIRSVSVTAPTVMEADALATALSIMEPAAAINFIQKKPNYACCIFEHSGKKHTSRTWQKTIA